jgi:hypothetical protein
VRGMSNSSHVKKDSVTLKASMISSQIDVSIFGDAATISLQLLCSMDEMMAIMEDLAEVTAPKKGEFR